MSTEFDSDFLSGLTGPSSAPFQSHPPSSPPEMTTIRSPLEAYHTETQYRVAAESYCHFALREMSRMKKIETGSKESFLTGPKAMVALRREEEEEGEDKEKECRAQGKQKKKAAAVQDKQKKKVDAALVAQDRRAELDKLGTNVRFLNSIKYKSREELDDIAYVLGLPMAMFEGARAMDIRDALEKEFQKRPSLKNDPRFSGLFTANRNSTLKRKLEDVAVEAVHVADEVSSYLSANPASTPMTSQAAPQLGPFIHVPSIPSYWAPAPPPPPPSHQIQVPAYYHPVQYLHQHSTSASASPNTFAPFGQHYSYAASSS
ncbi:hypothetical protein EUX98_g4774 [Antrodiella citrinella]|uniref:Uncharacterized protein n=1 Tax=Antrodiella citrinella TaxID=2447956 RepID=A0A4S4MTB3_9APHY|nr:hypothetical protein EUX98_g4774 [Antrodiella citrinella]